MTHLKHFRLLRFAALVLLLAALVTLSVQAEEKTGVLTVLLTGEDGSAVPEIRAVVYRVADVDGTPEADFAAAGIGAVALNDTAQDAKNARTLAAFAVAQNCSGTAERTDAAGAAHYTLREGIYLVRCEEGQSVVFPSFLVRLPLELDGKLYYDVDAFPKAEPAPEPTTEPPTEPGSHPDLPQTGWDPLPALCLAIGGVLLLTSGIIGLLRSREGHK